MTLDVDMALNPNTHPPHPHHIILESKKGLFLAWWIYRRIPHTHLTTPNVVGVNVLSAIDPGLSHLGVDVPGV